MMTSSTVISLCALTDEILEEQGKEAYQLTDSEFVELVESLHQRICIDGRWSSQSSWGSKLPSEESDELCQFLLGRPIHCYIYVTVLYRSDKGWCSTS